MKLKTTLLLAAATAASQAATTVSLTNFDGANMGLPVVDNTGVPVSGDSARVEVGTFAEGFSFEGLNAMTDDAKVIEAFTAAGGPIAFRPNGLFNNSSDVDSDGALGAAQTPLYALISYTPDGADPQALVLQFADAGTFPTQNDAGAASVDLGRLITLDDAVFGGGTIGVDTSTLPAPFQKAEFETGLTFDAIPEPSTSLLAAIAGLALLGRRRR